MRPSVARSILVFSITIFPSFVLFSKGGYAYAIPFALLTLLYLQLNDLQRSITLNYKKLITAIPVIALFSWMVHPGVTKLTEQQRTRPDEIKIAILLSCITVFVAITSALLIIKRIKGEKPHD